MDTDEERELRRSQWRAILLGGYEAQAGGRLKSITVSKRFDESLTGAELDSLASIALRLAEESGLSAALVRDGSSLCVQVSCRPKSTRLSRTRGWSLQARPGPSGCRCSIASSTSSITPREGRPSSERVDGRG